MNIKSYNKSRSEQGVHTEIQVVSPLGKVKILLDSQDNDMDQLAIALLAVISEKINEKH